MIKVKQKKCKGSGKAKDFIGCGEIHYIKSFGLCDKCFKEWMLTTESGELFLNKNILKAKNIIRKFKAKKDKEKSIEIMSVDEYRSKYVQPIFNEIARLIDYGQPCIATGYYTGKMNGGHYIAVGTNRTLALNLHNIHIQSFSSNSWKGGDNVKYRNGLLRVYGQEYLDRVDALQQIKPIHLSKEDLIEIKNKAIKIRNGLRESLVERLPHERIDLRDVLNRSIGIFND